MFLLNPLSDGKVSRRGFFHQISVLIVFFNHQFAFFYAVAGFHILLGLQIQLRLLAVFAFFDWALFPHLISFLDCQIFV